MKRYEIIMALQGLETTKAQFEKLKKDHNSFYHEGTTISAQIETRDFNRHYEEDQILVNHRLFLEYLDKEIDFIEKRIQEFIKELSS